MNDNYQPCNYCHKMNHVSLDKCAWCFRPIQTKAQRRFQAIVFWASITGILAAAYVAYRIGGIA